MSLDKRGFTPEYRTQVDRTIDILKNKPEILRDDISKFSIPKAALCNSDNALPRSVDEALVRFVEIYVAGTREVDLGAAVTWDEMKTDDWTVKCRRCHGRCYARYSHPSVDTIWGDVLDCSRVAAAAAVLAAIWASPEAALPAFKAAFYACLQAKGVGWAAEISVSLFTRNEYGDWHGCG